MSFRARRTLEQCAALDFQEHEDGPLAYLLMHLVVHPASVHLVLRDKMIVSALVTVTRAALHDVLLIAGAVFAGQPHDESAFRQRDAALTAVLLAAGHGRARINLEHNATLLPGPLLTVDQLPRLALHAMRCAHVEAALPACKAAMVAHLRRACSADDPAVPA